METIKTLLDKAKKLRSHPTDMALAAALHVKRQTVSQWRSGATHPDEVSCARIAEMTGEPLARVLGIVGEARAKDAAAKAVWRKLASAAAAILVTLAVYAGDGGNTVQAEGFDAPGYIHYAKSLLVGLAVWLVLTTRLKRDLPPGIRKRWNET